MRQHAPRFLLLGILLLAFFLRCYRLDAQSFWNDEGNSARISERPVALILEGTASDIHPPGYYLLLHCWRALFGQSEFALRAFSAVAGLALVVCTYLLGRHLFGEATGLTAAFLGAISPFAIYYSQEARMYALLGALAAASTLASYRLQIVDRRSRIVPLVVYVVTSTAGLYTHYSFAFVLLVHNAIFGLWWLAVGRRSARRWNRLALWVGGQAAVCVCYLPWLPAALRSVSGWSSAGRGYRLGAAVLDVFRVLSVGETLPPAEATTALVVCGALLCVGLWPGPSHAASPRKTGWFEIVRVALYLVLPIALIFAFDLYKGAWLKFLLVVLPPFGVIVAHGVENLVTLTHYALRIPHHVSRIAYCVLRILSILALAASTLPSLHNLYFNPVYFREDYRQIAADIAAAAHPGDAIILDAPNQWEVFTYYYPDRDVYPAPYHPEPGGVEAFLAPLAGQYRRLFVLYWGDAESDPERLIEAWLAAHTYKAGDRWYGRVSLATYGVASLPEAPAVALDARFGDALRLGGYALAGDAPAAGDILPVTLFWEAQAPIAERYKVTVQVLDGAGQLVAQHDTEPGDGLLPTTTWEPGQALPDRYGVQLPLDLRPGRYGVVVGVYHIVSGERLPVLLDGTAVGDHLALGEIEITK
jgi:mannosyltransferase